MRHPPPMTTQSEHRLSDPPALAEPSARRVRGTAACHRCLLFLCQVASERPYPSSGLRQYTLHRRNLAAPCDGFCPRTLTNTDACVYMRRLSDAIRVELQQPSRQLQRAQPASLGEARPVQRSRGDGGGQRRPAFYRLHRAGAL